MKEIEPGRIEEAVAGFLGGESDARLASRRRDRSWDLAFSHFEEHSRPTDVMELSCLHLGYYLASWGMLRGSSFLFRETNALHYAPVVEVIEKHSEHLRGWDVPDYIDAQRYDAYEAAWRDLRAVLLPEGGRSLTLISKVMMGVWGCIPSFDTYFVSTFRSLSESSNERSAWSQAGRESLRTLHEIYQKHTQEIESVRHKYPVWSMALAGPTERPMPRAKVLDIFGFYTTWRA